MIQLILFILCSTFLANAAYTPVKKRSSSQPLSSSILGYTYANMPTYDLKALGQQQHDRIFHKLWINNTFEHGPVCGDKVGAFNAWDWAVEMQAIADGYTVTSNSTFKNQMYNVYQGMEEFYDDKLNAYHVTPQSSSDIDYDDNAQIATAFIAAYKATKQQFYLRRANDIVNFLMKGWNNTYGGVTWSYGHTYIATISTSEAAISALKLYDIQRNDSYVSFAKKCLDFLFDTLWDESENLFYDGFSGTSSSKSGAHYNYHEGTALSLASLLYSYTKDSDILQKAQLLASVSINRSLAIYNRDTTKLNLRFYKDGANFTQLMVQGLVDYHNLVDSKNTTITNEILRSVRYLIDITSTGDGYFGDGDGYQNSQDTTKIWNMAMGETNSWTPDTSQYCEHDTSKGIDFTLLYQASMLRCLWLASTVQQYI